MPAWKAPVYPPILTKANWDRTKGIIAKMHGRTGIGEELAKLKKLFDAVDWDAIKVIMEKPRGLNDFTLKDWNQKEAKALQQADGNVQKVVNACQEVEKLCRKDIAPKFKKSKTIPSSSTAQVVSIADTAKKFASDLATEKLMRDIEKGHADGLEYVTQICLPMQGILKKVLTTKVPAAIAAVQKAIADEQAGTKPAGYAVATWYEKIQGEVGRDVSQNVVNIAKFINNGVPFTCTKEDAAAGEREARRWASPSTKPLKAKATPEQVQAELNDFKEAVKIWIRIAQ